MLPRVGAAAQQHPVVDIPEATQLPPPLPIANERPLAAAQAGAAATSPARSYVTARGAIVALFGLFLASNLLAGWFGLEVLAGLGYVAGCVLAPYFVRRHALLQVVVAPPAIFLMALVITQMATAQGTGRHGKVLSVLEGTVLTLAALAPWLLSGTALGVGVAVPRGLLKCVRDLKSELREDLAQRRPWAPRTREPRTRQPRTRWPRTR